MPFLLLITFALTVGIATGLITWRLSRTRAGGSTPSLDAARKVGETVGRHERLRRVLRARLDPAAATGLLLTLALLFVVGGGAVIGVLAYLARTNAQLARIDNWMAAWGNRHASELSTHGLNAVTQLGSIYTIVALCLVLAVVETIRERSVWVVPFIFAVIAGEEALTLTVKQLADRVRPTLNPLAETLGPSFPSGHSATAAAFYATAALLLGRWRGRPTRALLAGCAAAIATGVAASRVLLDLHWLSDVIAGLALGWAWFAVCAIAFGGRILRFGTAAETAAQVAATGRAGSVQNARPVRW
jgi:membrane-associated phospholipid phosphatase